MMTDKANEVVVFGGGCFWCTEAVFKMLRGVVAVTSGYTGGSVENPSYEQVHTGKTGHVEVVKVEFRPDEISFRQLLEVFFSAHDPTTLNKQGHDIGEQYKSVIFYTSSDQKNQAVEYIEELNQSGEYEGLVVTEVLALNKFYEAEEEHKDYYANNSEQAYCQIAIDPKLEKVRRKYSEWTTLLG